MTSPYSSPRRILIVRPSWSQLTLSRNAGESSGSAAILAQEILEAANATKCLDGPKSVTSTSSAKIRREQLHVRSWLSKFYEGAHFTFSLWFGPGDVLSQHGTQNPKSDDHDGTSGYGAALAFGNRLGLPLRLELMILWSYAWYESQLASSLRWNISLPPIIDYSKAIMDLLIVGNVDGMKEEFSMKRATPFDTCIDGTTLLHVCES